MSSSKPISEAFRPATAGPASDRLSIETGTPAEPPNLSMPESPTPPRLATDRPSDGAENSGWISDGAHLDGLDIADPDAPPPPDPAEIGVGPDGLLTREAFGKMVLGAMRFGGEMASLKALAEAPDRPTAAPACDALYDTCREVPALRWLLHPGGVWMQRAVAIGAFVLPVGKAVAVEIAAKRAPRAATAMAAEGIASPSPAVSADVVDIPRYKEPLRGVPMGAAA